MKIHVVAPNETLFSISNMYGLTPDFLQNINQLPNPSNLVVGQSIIILFPKIMHTVMPGETLSSIAKMYSVSVMSLIQNNPQINNINHIVAGSSIVIKFENQNSLNRDIIANAYTYANLNQDYLKTVFPYLTYITPFTYGINDDGNLIPVDDFETTTLALAYDVKPIMHISTLTQDGRFSNALAKTILSNTSLQYKIIENILKEIEEKNYEGLDIDFEFILPENKYDYAVFVTRLTKELNKNGYILIIALAPKTSATQKGLLYEGHDYFALGNASNYVFIMTYEWGYTYGPPMAVAPIESVKRVLDYTVTEIEPSKTLMGIPTYGYNWTLPYVKGESKAISISNTEAINTALKYGSEILFDGFSQSPYFYYTDENGLIHEVWFEDARSIYAKLMLVKEYGLSGVGYWNIERPFPQNWMILNQMFHITKIKSR